MICNACKYEHSPLLPCGRAARIAEYESLYGKGKPPETEYSPVRKPRKERRINPMYEMILDPKPPMVRPPPGKRALKNLLATPRRIARLAKRMELSANPKPCRVLKPTKYKDRAKRNEYMKLLMRKIRAQAKGGKCPQS